MTKEDSKDVQEYEKDIESLEISDDSGKEDQEKGSNAYKRRNVYKSIIRHMFSYTRKNRNEIIRVLKENCFDMAKIEHAFFKVNYFNDLERQKGKSKKSQATVKKIIVKKSIYTYILRETLYAMMQNWKVGKTGKISEDNLTIYREVCQKFYDDITRLLAQGAQGTSFLL